jgi:UDP-N-acetylmuramoylalanine--D-glutamate ligase
MLDWQKKLITIIGGKNVCLVGFGREGQSTLKVIQTLDPGKKFTVVDVKSDPDYLKTLKDYDLIIRSPGVPLKLVKKHAATKAIITSQTKLFFDLCPAKIVGVTGTKGKSTTVSVITAVLKQKFITILVGNIGRPPLDYLAKIKPESLVVFELSSHQLSDLDKSPQVAVLLNLFPEHLDYYVDFQEYAQAKARISRFQTKKDLLIYNIANQQVRKIAAEGQARKISFSATPNAEADCFIKSGYIYWQKQPIFPIEKSPLQGQFNLANIMPGIIIGKEFGITTNLIVAAIEKFRSLPHRLEIIDKVDGITYINDSLSTVPEAAIQAIKAFKNTLGSLIVGGYDRGVDQTSLAQTIINYQVPLVITLPETGRKIKNIIDQHQNKVKIYETETMELAVALAKKYTPRGKICLLSPAAASFNLFRDYKDRGNQFKAYVKKLY